MKKDFNGTGTILCDEEPLCSGSYNITKDSGPERQTRQSGTFKVSGLETSKLIDMLNQPPRDLILVIEGGEKFDIQLTHIHGSQNFESGSAQFNITFFPGNQEI